MFDKRFVEFYVYINTKTIIFGFDKDSVRIIINLREMMTYD